MKRIKLYWGRRPGKLWRIVWLALLATVLILHFSVWVLVRDANSRQAAASLTSLVQRDTTLFKEHFEIYADTLYSGRALLSVEPNVSRTGWTTFVDAQDITQRYPGVQTIAYVSVTSRSQAADLIAQLNANRTIAETKPIIIYPTTTNSQLAVLNFLAPQNVMQQAIGYDLYSSHKRQIMLFAARDSGQPRASVPLSLITDTSKGNGSLLIAMPVYAVGSQLNSVSQRRAALQGYIVMALDIKPLVDSVLLSDNTAGNVSVVIRTDSQQIYQSSTRPNVNGINQTASLNVAGQIWSLRFNAPADYSLTAREKVAAIVILSSTIPIALALIVALYLWLRLKILQDNINQPG